MRNFPRHINTKVDLLNCLALVQSGALTAADLRRAINAIRATKWLHVPILAESEEVYTIPYCNEIAVGQELGNSVTVIAVTHIAGEEGPQKTEVTLSCSPGAGMLLIPNPGSPLERFGVTDADLDAMEGVLSNHE